jgi:hypothetical protein
MAKQLVNPFERHLEKLVLAIAGLLLIGVLVKFVFSSPNKILLGTEPATPGVVDARLAQKANDILDRIKNWKPPVVEHDSKFDDFVAIEPIRADTLPLVSVLGPDVPIVDARAVVTGGAELVAIPPAPKPVFTLGRNTLLAPNVQGGETRTPVDWVMLAIPFDVKGQSELQRRAWGATRADVIFATPEVQRRMRKSDASWSEGDWQTISGWSSYKMPNPPTVRLSESGGKVVANKDDQKAAEKYQEEMADPKVQLAILRPLPPSFAPNELAWKFPLVTTYENVVKQDQEFISPNNPSAPIEDRYGLSQAGTGKPKPEPRTAAQEQAQKLDAARAQLEAGRKLWSKNEVTLAFNAAVEVSNSKEATPDLKSKAQKLMKEAELLLEDIKRKKQPTDGKGEGSAKPGKEPKRDKSPHQDIWAYDAAADSIVNGQTYQYRMRARVLNRLAGMPESFKKPENAQVMIVAGEWSEPTDPIHIAEDSWFFVTREDKPKREIFVEFFRWYDGVWVKSKAVNFKEGQALVHQERVPVPDLVDATVAVTPTVDFGEDLTLLDIEFARPMRERKAGSTATGVKFAAQPAPATAAVFVDGKGGLHERVVAADKENPLRRKIEIWSPSKKAPAP